MFPSSSNLYSDDDLLAKVLITSIRQATSLPSLFIRQLMRDPCTNSMHCRLCVMMLDPGLSNFRRPVCPFVGLGTSQRSTSDRVSE